MPSKPVKFVSLTAARAALPGTEALPSPVAGGAKASRHIRRAVLASLAACAMSLPASVALADIVRSGTVEASFTIRFTQAPPASSSVSCNLALIGSDALAPSDVKSVSAPVSGTSAVCDVSVPYEWRLKSASSNMTIAYTVSGPQQTSSAIYNIIAVPADGATTVAHVAITQ
jgi:hypothetical protein